MAKKYVYLLLVVFVINIIIPVRVEAKNIEVNDLVQVGTKLGDISECKTILGDVNNENSVAWLVQKILNYIKILGPTIAIVLSSIDFTKAIVTSDDDSMKKAQSKFIKRMIAALLLFFVPLITQILLGLFGFTSDNAICGLQ